MSNVEFRVAARDEKPRVRSVWSALLVTVGGALSVMCSGSVDGASGDGGAGETPTEQGGAASDGGRASGGRSTIVGGAVGGPGHVHIIRVVEQHQGLGEALLDGARGAAVLCVVGPLDGPAPLGR